MYLKRSPYKVILGRIRAKHSASSLKVFICNFCLPSNASISWLGTSFFPRGRHLWIRCFGARVDFKIVLLRFKNLNDLAPYYLSSLLLKYQPACLLRSSNRLLLQVPSVNTVAYRHRSFSYYVPIIWTGLLDHIKNFESVSTLKQRLKTFLSRNNCYI